MRTKDILAIPMLPIRVTQQTVKRVMSITTISYVILEM